jgi:hypothetical protein
LSSGGSYGNVPLQVLAGSLPVNTYVAAATNFFAANLSPTRTPCTLRIYIALSVSAVVSAQRTLALTSATAAELLNSGVALAANAAYYFDVQMDEGETFNLQSASGATVLKCMVTEIDTV